MRKKKKTNDGTTIKLYKAVESYVRERGGTVMVAGGVEIQQWPSDFRFNYRVAVHCTGRVPKEKRK